MAEGVLSAEFQLAGEKEYRDAIKNINAGLGVLNSELRKVSAEFDNNADSIEALNASNDVLDRKLSSQRDKVELLKNALADSVENYGESSRKTMDFARQLNDAEAALKNTEAEIRQNNSAIEEYQSVTHELNDLISSVDSKLTLYNSELERVKAQYSDSADSAEAYAAENEVLNKILDEQRNKISDIFEAMERADEAELDNLQLQLNRAEAAAYKTEAAIRKNSEAMQEEEEESYELSTVLDDVADRLGIKIPDGVSKSLEGFGNFSVESVAAFGASAAAVKLVIDAVNELTDITKQAAGYVDDLMTTSTKTGIDTYTLQVLSYMEDLADVDMSSVTGEMTKLTKSMSDAAGGSKAAQEAFSALGVSITENGHLRETTDVFWEAIDALGQMEAGTERDALAMDIFGKKAQDLNTLIDVGSEGFRQFAQEAENVGYIIGEKDLKALNDYQDALDRAQKTQEAMQQVMAAKMAPALTELTEGWSNLKTEGLQLIIDSGIIDFLADLCTVIGKVVGFVGDMLEALNMLLHPIDSLKELLGIQNETLEENAAMYDAATEANEGLKESVSGDSAVMNQMAMATNNATNSLKQFAIEAGYAENISEKRLQELGAYSQANGSRGAGFFGDFAGMSNSDFKALLDQNGITKASQISSVLGEDAYRFYKASASYNASGDYNFAGGWTEVGENGPEKVFLPQGSRIMSAQESRSDSSIMYVTVNVDHLDDVEQLKRIISEARQSTRGR